MKNTKNQHFLPKTYIKRVMNIKSESLYRWNGKDWESKKPDKIHSWNKIYNLSKYAADLFFDGDIMGIEEHFGRFEDKWTKIADNFDGTKPFEEYIIYKKMHLNFEYRNPITINASKIEIGKPLKKIYESETNEELIKRSLMEIASAKISKNSGDLVLKILIKQYAQRLYSKTKNFNDLFYEITILNFDVEMPLLNIPFQIIRHFENLENNKIKWSLNKENEKIGILQINSKKWFMINFNKEINPFTLPWDKRVIIADNGRKNTTLYAPYKEVSVAIEECKKIRYAMMQAKCYSKIKDLGIKNNQYIFESSLVNEQINLSGEVLKIELNHLNEILSCLEKVEYQWGQIFSETNSEFNSSLEILNHTETELIEKIINRVPLEKIIIFMKSSKE